MSCELANYQNQAEQQQLSNWCWAAVATSVVKYYDPPSGWTQSLVAQAVLGAVVNSEARLEDALIAVGRFSHPAHAGVVPYPGCETEICVNGCPIGIGILWPGIQPSYHFVTMIGVSDVGGVPYVTIHDPLPVGGMLNIDIMPYAEILSDYDNAGGSWQWTYLTI